MINTDNIKLIPVFWLHNGKQCATVVTLTKDKKGKPYPELNLMLIKKYEDLIYPLEIDERILDYHVGY